MTREELTQGYINLLESLFEPESFFDRLDDLFINRRFYDYAERVRGQKFPHGIRLRALGSSLGYAAYLFMKLIIQHNGWRLRAFYVKRLINFLAHRPNPVSILDYVVESIHHHNLFTMSQYMATRRSSVINTY